MLTISFQFCRTLYHRILELMLSLLLDTHLNVVALGARPQKCNFRQDIDDYEIFGNEMYNVRARWGMDPGVI